MRKMKQQVELENLEGLVFAGYQESETLARHYAFADLRGGSQNSDSVLRWKATH